ncbi:MAG: hypothetical protein L6Q37_12755 [Bdellovibrionaceae bacterium]|nr:hypothetical protein [Pseudobdellovibrionaceae bacterium]NUM57684.1 hypothetical protein [Pseudobdellovibrionaceae bacterium]
MSFFCRTIQFEDVNEILDFEEKKLLETMSDESDRIFARWNSKWRQESLEHYSKLGWSFLARNKEIPSTHSAEGALVGYFTAQPLLFLDGQTQSLWIEHLAYNSLQARDQLSELAYKLAREKHFQRVFFPNTAGIINSINTYKPDVWNPQNFLVKTVK